MRILLHDYAGHPFQVQLSRRLAARGHDVLHLYCDSTLTPRGELIKTPDDPTGFDVRAISLGEVIPKASFLKRFGMERRYGPLLVDACRSWRPDVVLSANTPSLPQHALTKMCRSEGIRLVSWIQDIYSIAAQKVLKKKLPIVGSLAANYFIHLDKVCARASDAVVVITEDFTPLFEKWGVDAERIHAIHNWAPLDNLPVRERENAWSSAQGLGDKPRFLYSGTLSLKTNPELLLSLARRLGEQDAGELVVVSEGAGADWLREHAPRYPDARLRILGFQPFEQMPDMLGSADVLVAILEPEAGVFCVPSKVLTYLCAQRPLLLAVPQENLAAKIVTNNKAGRVVAPDDLDGFCEAGMRLADSPDGRAAYGSAARTYAETHFDIEAITTKFERALSPSTSV